MSILAPGVSYGEAKGQAKGWLTLDAGNCQPGPCTVPHYARYKNNSASSLANQNYRIRRQSSVYLNLGESNETIRSIILGGKLPALRNKVNLSDKQGFFSLDTLKGLNGNKEPQCMSQTKVGSQSFGRSPYMWWVAGFTLNRIYI